MHVHVASTHCESGHGRYEAGLRGSEASEAEVLLKVWDVLHPRAVGEGASAARGSGGCGRAKQAAWGCSRA